jgi:hypothetical protein
MAAERTSACATAGRSPVAAANIAMESFLFMMGFALSKGCAVRFSGATPWNHEM